MTIELMVFLIFVGLAMGSFVEALTHRLKTGQSMLMDRSECVNCHHKLGPWDLIPLVSWLSLGGKCRYCKKPIGWHALILELVMPVLFVGSYLLWPVDLASWQAVMAFVFWLIYLVILVALVVYDLKYMILPDKLVWPLIVLATVDVIFGYDPLVTGQPVVHAGLGILLLTGFYGGLYVISSGRWVGFGDVKLSIFLGMVLGWQKALLAIMVSNVIGLLVVLPGLITGKLNRKSRVPFGPFLVAGFIISALLGQYIIHWYLNLFVNFS